MRILLANDQAAGAGGVESYLAALLPALAAEGHEVALLHDGPIDPRAPIAIARDGTWRVGVRHEGLRPALTRVRTFAPDVCFSHNMAALEIDEALASRWPVVKMLHGHFGTCVSARKTFAFPHACACTRDFGPACLIHYLPRRCGAASPTVMMREYAWARRQRALFARYASVVVASAFMREGYAHAGVNHERLFAVPLFATATGSASIADFDTRRIDVLFLGRLTALKGPDVLLRAIAAHVPSARVVIAGDGPERAVLQRIAQELRTDVRFTGWVTGPDRDALLGGARVLAVPSVWPEPFGLVGLEAAAFGTPAVAFDSGGVSEWLRDGVNGALVASTRGADGLGRAIAGLLRDREAWAPRAAQARETAARLSLARHVSALTEVLTRAAAAAHSYPARA